MPDPATLSFALLLLAISAVLVAWQTRHRPDPSKAETPAMTAEEDEQEFRRRQYRRRTQASLMVGVAGLLLLLGDIAPGPLWRFLHLVVLLALLGWIILLAVADIIATWHHFGRLRQQHFLDGARRGANLDRASSRPTEDRPGGQA